MRGKSVEWAVERAVHRLRVERAESGRRAKGARAVLRGTVRMDEGGEWHRQRMQRLAA